MPPTVNSYWGLRTLFNKASKRWMALKYTTDEGKAYTAEMKERVMDLRMRYFSKAPLAMMLVVCFRDARRADLDNRVKSFQDALKAAGVYEDDCQIELLQVIRGPNIQDGRVMMFLSEITIDKDRLLADALAVKYIAPHYPTHEVVTPQQSGELFEDVAGENGVRRSARRKPVRRRALPPGGDA